MPSPEVHTNATMQDPHYVFKDGQWARAYMSEHPKVQVTISVNCAHLHVKTTSTSATNVTAIADTSAEVNPWSLSEFLQHGFTRDILTRAPNLVAANHSSQSIAGTFIAFVQGLSCHNHVQCHAVVYTDVKALFLSNDTIEITGVLLPIFRH